jgi:CubicO group peptidase (beta-lactamase class C family)
MEHVMIRVGDIAVGRAGDKGDVLDLTLVARDDAAYERLAHALDADTVRTMLNRVVPGPMRRYEVPGLRALKYVLPQALAGGVYASLRPGLHWQKAAIWLLLDLRLDDEGKVHGAA